MLLPSDHGEPRPEIRPGEKTPKIEWQSGYLKIWIDPSRQTKKAKVPVNSDHISGVVVLQNMPTTGRWGLWFEYTRSDGIIGYSYIPVKRKSDPRPTQETGPLWDFVERSPFLDCSPSVRILGPREGAPDHFHNTGQWTNPYVVMAYDYDQSEPEARTVCQMINRFKTKEERDGVIFELRAKRVLL